MQQRINNQPAFLLHRRDYRESSLILDLLTLDFGLISVVARAAKSQRNRGHFLPGNTLLVGFSGQSELKTLTGIESQALSLSGDGWFSLYYVNELLLYLLPRHEEHREVFLLYQGFLQQLVKLSADSQREQLLRFFEMDLLSQFGHMPELGCLSASGEPLQIGSDYYFTPDHGVSDSAEMNATLYPADTLLAISRRDLSAPPIRSACKRIMRSIIDFHLNGRRLQSREIYRQMMSGRKK